MTGEKGKGRRREGEMGQKEWEGGERTWDGTGRERKEKEERGYSLQPHCNSWRHHCYQHL